MSSAWTRPKQGDKQGFIRSLTFRCFYIHKACFKKKVTWISRVTNDAIFWRLYFRAILTQIPKELYRDAKQRNFIACAIVSSAARDARITVHFFRLAISRLFLEAEQVQLREVFSFRQHARVEI